MDYLFLQLLRKRCRVGIETAMLPSAEELDRKCDGCCVEKRGGYLHVDGAVLLQGTNVKQATQYAIRARLFAEQEAKPIVLRTIPRSRVQAWRSS